VRQRFNRQDRATILSYLIFLILLIAATGYSARNIIFKSWTKRTWGSAVAVNNSIYVFGGLGENAEIYRDILKLDLKKGKIYHSGKLPSARYAVSASYLNGSIYIAGGYSESGYLNEVLGYNPGSKRVWKAAELPYPLCFGSTVTVGGKLYYLGGWDGKTYRDTILYVDLEKGKSVPVGRLPQALEMFSAVSANGRVYIIGGENNFRNYTDKIVELRPENWKPIREASLPSARARLACVSFNSSIYCAGGWNGDALDDIILVEPFRNKIKVKTVSHIPYPVSDRSLTAIKPYIYLIGGTSKQSRRQIGIIRIKPSTLKTEDISLKSYSWN